MDEIPFTELLSDVIDNRGRTCPVSEEGLPLIATNCITNDRLYPSYDTTRRVSSETYRTWFRGHPIPGDLIFVCKGSPGRVCVVPDPVDFCIAQDMVAVRPDPKKIYPRYLFAALRSSLVQSRIENMHVGTLIPHFKKGDFNKLSIPLPSREAQREIGDLYFELSSKIEQNRRTSSALECLARAIFRAWFVDFEPVKDKAGGAISFPLMHQAVFDALPTDLVDSDIGVVPVGWQLRPLYETAKFINGAAFKSEDFCAPSDGLPVVKIAELKAGINDRTKYSHRRDLVEKHQIDNGEMLYSWSGSPDTSLDTFLWTGGKGLLNQHIFRVVTTSAAHKYFLFYLLKHLRQPLVEIARNKQTTGLGHVTVADMRRLLVCWPSRKVFDGFAEQIEPLFETGFLLMAEAEKLAQVRDYLLPHMLSGQARIEASNG